MARNTRRSLFFLLFVVLVPLPARHAAAQVNADLDAVLTSVDSFLVRQLAKFPVPNDYPSGFEGAQLIQTYDLLPPVLFDDSESPLRHRSDVYDSSLAAIYFTKRGDITHAKQLADGLRFVQSRDPRNDGRVRISYYANDLLDPSNQFSSRDDLGAATGPTAWAGLALTQFYDHVQKNNLLNNQAERDQYLDAAKAIGNWLIDNVQQDPTDGFGGFSLGKDDSDDPLFGTTHGRSTEQNIDVFVLANNLYELDRDPSTNAPNPAWLAMAQNAQGFVHSMFDDTNGRYMTGTHENATTGVIEVNPAPIPADVQTWSVLADINQQSGDADRTLQWLQDNLQINGPPFTGVKFSDLGDNIQSEETASAVLALLVAGHTEDAEDLFDDLDDIRLTAPSSDPNGIGVVATPSVNGARSGFEGVSDPPTYPNTRHVASTVWTGLAALAFQGDPGANPLQTVPEPSTGVIFLAIGTALYRRRRPAGARQA